MKTTTHRENPIAIRSKKKLMDALLQLMNEKPYKDISVTELCGMAKLSRPAFYKNFGEIDNVLKCYLSNLFERTADAMNLTGVLTAEEIARQYFNLLEQHHDLMTLLAKNNLLGFVIEVATEQFMKMPTTFNNLDDEVDQDTKDLYAAFVSAGIATTVVAWINADRTMDQEDIISIIAMAIEGRPFRSK